MPILKGLTKAQCEIIAHYLITGEDVQPKYLQHFPLHPDNIKTLKGRDGSLLRREVNKTTAFYGHPIYLGGSSLHKPNGGRDIDLFCLLPEKDFCLRYLNNYKAAGDNYTQKCEQWALRWNSGMFDQGNWQWADDTVKKSIAFMYATDLIIDFKVLPITYHEKNYYHMPLLRIDTRENPKYFWPDEH